MQEQNNNQSLLSLIKEFVSEFTSLAYQHFKLFKEECAEDFIKIIKSIILLIFALILSYTGLIFLGFLIVELLSMIMPEWTALLLVTAVYFGVPMVMLIYAINLLAKVFTGPKKFITEIKKTGEDTKKWLKNIKQNKE